ncbi:hypothetical protein [Streptomyces sp. NPDC089919]|uniref:hypothetical protein n=1 Tax=Streptomyces sp. NPDC089919 TaxID=3155188 RepID=UPI00342C309F
MAFRSARVPLPYLLGSAMALSLGITTCGSYAPAHAAGEDWVPITIRNGNFSKEAAGTAVSKIAPEFWVNEFDDGTVSANPTWLVPATKAKHPKWLQAVGLNGDTGAQTVQTRLWGVRDKTTVELKFDAAPSTSDVDPSCTGAAAPYKVGPTGTAFTTPASGWRTETVTFTAVGDHPKISFTSTGGANKCGALITNVTARVDRNTFTKPNQFIKRNDLPWTAYKALVLTPVDWNTANSPNQFCSGSAVGDCYFVVDPSRTYKYFAENRILGNAYLNCTRNAITDKRTVSWTEEGFDPFNQEANRVKTSIAQSKENKGGDDYDLGRETTSSTTVDYLVRFKAVEAGYQRNDLNPNQANTETPLTSPRTTSQDITVTVQPGEASWIEVQPARERIAGVYSGNLGAKAGAGQVRSWISIDTMLDFPSSKAPDRAYQRTGPLTETERKHCMTERPLLVTPDNDGTPATPGVRNAPAPAGNANLVTAQVTPAGRETRSVPVAPQAK